MPNVEVYLDSRLTETHVLEFGAPRILLATGARWRRDGIGRTLREPVPGFDHRAIATPDDLMAEAEAYLGDLPKGRVAIFDDDQYYMAAVLAELIHRHGRPVTLVTTGGTAAAWSRFTDEHDRTNRRLLELGIEIRTSRAASGYDGEALALDCIFTGKRETLATAGVVTVTSREPNDELYRSLVDRPQALAAAGIKSVIKIGDCDAPALVAHAVYAGHRAARELDADPASILPLIERPPA